ncbi:MAG: patatin-like phospholipase family protein [Rhodospirillales bacterium]|nr:patatin-like phospholipase family protein [Rhodospirillales bacterium]
MVQPFELGLAMAVGTSGGVYSAGVVDFLIEALDAWYAAKASQSSGGASSGASGGAVPNHDVTIKVLSGSSAGAICSALAGVALHAETTPVHDTNNPPAGNRNRLFHCWVERADIADLLKTDDIDSDGAFVRSLLNPTELGRIALEGFEVEQRKTPRPYVSDPLPLFLTVSNLRGVPYEFYLAGDDQADTYGMLAHGDHMRFLMGSGQKGNTLFTGLDTEALPDGENWLLFADSALASGAFPLGLQPRRLKRPTAQYDERLDVGVPARFPSGFPDSYEFLCVDGGLINNEPLELARRYLAGEGRYPAEEDKRNPQTATETHRAVMMIDPFPNQPEFEARYTGKDDIVSVLKAMFRALMNQARFKPEELALAKDPEVFSRFAISPSLRPEGGTGQMDAAIIASILDGFGGFLAREFRRHDFELGRRNCQRFLQRHFVLPANNERIFGSMFKNDEMIKAWCVRDGKGQKVYSKSDPSQGPMMPIIPLVDGVKDPIGRPERPGLDAVDLRLLEQRIKHRARAVCGRLAEQALKDKSCLCYYAGKLYVRHRFVPKFVPKAMKHVRCELSKLEPVAADPSCARKHRQSVT